MVSGKAVCTSFQYMSSRRSVLHKRTRNPSAPPSASGTGPRSNHRWRARRFFDETPFVYRVSHSAPHVAPERPQLDKRASLTRPAFCASWDKMRWAGGSPPASGTATRSGFPARACHPTFFSLSRHARRFAASPATSGAGRVSVAILLLLLLGPESILQMSGRQSICFTETIITQRL